jgi:hypothetical protein
MSDANGSNEVNKIWPNGLPGWKESKCELVVSEYWDRDLEVERFLIGKERFERERDAHISLDSWKRLPEEDFARLLSHARGAKHLRFECFRSVDGNFELSEVIELNMQTRWEIEREASRRLERELSESRGRYGKLIIHLWLFAAVFLVLAMKYFIF